MTSYVWAASIVQVSQGVKAESALLVEARTGRVLFSRNIDEPLPPASTTKLMTALLTYEQTGLRGSVKVATQDTKVEPTKLSLVPGETVPVIGMVKSLLVGSANDCAMSLARYVGGGVVNFSAMMNRRAHELGCTRTTFKNPNGLPAQGQLTTARDLLKIFQAAISKPELRQMCQTKSFVIRTARGTQTVSNHNKLLGVFPGMGPAKTGWTYSSKHTYAASASRNGRELHLIILKSPNKWTDATLLFNYGFERLGQPGLVSVSR
ncbi:MAG: serine hydrolase [Verrucomicrobiae bacterium]|nr:serine hydrolase [Verrucomicrobiae bacterium]